MKTKLPAFIIAVSALAWISSCYLTGCATTGTNAQTMAVIVEIATIEAAAKLKPVERLELKAVISTASVNLRQIAADGRVNIDTIVDAIESSGKLSGKPDILRWARHVALIVRTQWQGIAIDPARVNALAEKLDSIAATL